MIDFNPNQINRSTAPIARSPRDLQTPAAANKQEPPTNLPDAWVSAPPPPQNAPTAMASSSTVTGNPSINDAWGGVGGVAFADAQEVSGGGLLVNGKQPTKFSSVSRRECAAVLKNMSFGTDSLCHADAARLATMAHDIPSPASLV